MRPRKKTQELTTHPPPHSSFAYLLTLCRENSVQTLHGKRPEPRGGLDKARLPSENCLPEFADSLLCLPGKRGQLCRGRKGGKSQRQDAHDRQTL